MKDGETTPGKTNLNEKKTKTKMKERFGNSSVTTTTTTKSYGISYEIISKHPENAHNMNEKTANKTAVCFSAQEIIITKCSANKECCQYSPFSSVWFGSVGLVWLVLVWFGRNQVGNEEKR